MFRHSQTTHLLRALCLLLALLPALAHTPVAYAADPCVVTSGEDSGAGTLRTAVDSVGDGGCASGPITFLSGVTEVRLTSLLRIDRALTINGPGREALTLRYTGTSTSQGNVVIITAGPTILRDLTLADGRTEGSLYGSGVRIAPSAQRVVDVTLARVRVSGNQAATNGGGVYATNANLTITDSVIENNTAGASGGGLYLRDTNGPVVATLTNTVVAGNTAASAGGGIAAYDTDASNGRSVSLTLNGGTVVGTTDPTATNRGNHADNSGGGGVEIDGTSLTMRGATVAGNTVVGYGGGIRVINGGQIDLRESSIANNQALASGAGGGISVAGAATIDRSTIMGNRASFSGGIQYDGGTLTLTNSTISGNRSSGTGGGLFMNSPGTVTLAFVTITGNSAESSPGGFFADTGATIRGSVIVGNSATAGDADCTGELASQGYNLVGVGSCSVSGTGDQRLGAAGVLDPTLAANGGPTPTHALPPGSPAIDAGGPTCPATDQRGNARPQGLSCDAGAFEVQPTTPSPSPSPSTGPVPSFADVPPGYWAHDQIITFAQRGITTGCGDNDLGQRLYCPERGVTRAEMATFLTRALGQDKQMPPATPTFADVPADYWAYGQIEAFVNLGITTGCGLNDAGQRIYCPDRGVTRAEMAAFLDRAKNQTELANSTPTFADVPPSYWAYGWIERFFTLSITTGCGEDDGGNKVYCPDRGVTRAEMAVFIIRAYP